MYSKSQKKYYEKNKDKILSKNKEYYEKNKENISSKYRLSSAIKNDRVQCDICGGYYQEKYKMRHEMQKNHWDYINI